MRLAILSDIHSNFDALQAVARDMRQQSIDRMICLGDVIGYGAQPCECIDWITKHKAYCIKGNHEAMTNQGMIESSASSEMYRAIQWTTQQLNPDQLHRLRSWPVVSSYQQIVLAHGSPWHPAGFHYLMDRPDAAEAFHHFSTRLCLVGHTHVPAVVIEEESGSLIRHQPAGTIRLMPQHRYIINTGSVGQSRNGIPKAHWGIMDLTRSEMTFRAVEYEVEAAANKIIQAGLPAGYAARLYTGR